MRLRSPFFAIFAASLLIVFAAALLAGCSVGPDFARPAKPTATAYTPEPLAPQTASAAGPGGEAQSFVSERDIPGEWWTLFRSAALNRLVGESLQANPDLDAAQAALRQAHENVYAEQGGAVPDAQRQRLRPAAAASLASQGLGSSSTMFGVTAARSTSPTRPTCSAARGARSSRWRRRRSSSASSSRRRISR